MKMKVWPGAPYPLGAIWDGGGVNFALFAENATQVELCLFDTPVGLQEVARIPLHEHTDQVWHVYLPEVRPGKLYGYRVTARMSLRLATASIPPSSFSIPMPKPLRGLVDWNDAAVWLHPGACRRRSLPR